MLVSSEQDVFETQIKQYFSDSIERESYFRITRVF